MHQGKLIKHDEKFHTARTTNQQQYTTVKENMVDHDVGSL